MRAHLSALTQAFDGEVGLAMASPVSEGGLSEVYFWLVLTRPFLLLLVRKLPGPCSLSRTP